ncbi:hypothetical protein IIA_06002 [Bacillus cereus VD014]|uniref:Luciferase-like domain-containing protein n=1 Tax=Bacillus cereus (strain VD014) TaxID=1053223 RepID=A0A9W5K1W1_BACC8|nr:hypothetical protein IIA_06002 [Bacillus cereus VD014]
MGSSDFSVRFAAEQGLPFAFATHLSPKYTLPALEIYRTNFIPSDVLEEPYAMVSVNIIAAESDEKAKWLATSQLQQFLSSRRGKESAPLKPPDEYSKSYLPYFYFSYLCEFIQKKTLN